MKECERLCVKHLPIKPAYICYNMRPKTPLFANKLRYE